jgi:hypothetical protein
VGVPRNPGDDTFSGSAHTSPHGGRQAILLAESRGNRNAPSPFGFVRHSKSGHATSGLGHTPTKPRSSLCQLSPATDMPLDRLRSESCQKRAFTKLPARNRKTAARRSLRNPIVSVSPHSREESLTPTALRNALRASILAIAGFAAKSILSAPTGMIIVCDRAAFGITDGKVDRAIGCARASNHCLKST